MAFGKMRKIYGGKFNQQLNHVCGVVKFSRWELKLPAKIWKGIKY
jgi:hypothetical protein